jgi:hypothetical protein
LSSPAGNSSCPYDGKPFLREEVLTLAKNWFINRIMNEYHNILSRVKKPSRYLGNEINAVRKDIASVETRVALVLPDL